MDDFFVLAALALLLLPIALIAMQILLLSRQNRQHETINRSLSNLQQILGEHTQRLTELSRRLEPLQTESLASASFQIQPEVVEQIPEPSPAIDLAAEPPSPTEDIPAQAAAGNPWADEPQFAEPSRFELAAQKILREIWNWLIVGDSHQQEGVAMEYAIASNWLLRIGVLILVTGIGFFLKYSIDNGLLGEQARVALTVLAGVAMVATGVRQVGGQYHLFGLGLLGGGIAVLYFSVFAAFNFYHLLAVYPTFALMILVTACAATLAIKLDAMLVAIFAIIGGYCTPILLSTGQVNFVGLFSYMLLLGAGMLAINWYKHWHLLNFLSFFFNYLLFFGAMQHYQAEYFWQVLPFLGGFFVLYSTMVFLFCLVNRSRSTLLDLIALIVNAAIFFVTARQLILAEYGSQWVAVMTVVLAAFYIGHVFYCLARRIADRELLLSFMGLAAFFITITLPILLSQQWITVSWSIQALVMLWMAGKLRSAFLQQIAYLLYLIVLFRFCFIDMPGQYGETIDNSQTFGHFMLGLLERLISFGIPIASLALAYRLIGKPAPASPLACSSANDVPLWLKDNWLLQAALIIVAGLLFVVVQLELYRSFGYLYPPLQLPMLTLVWLTLGLLLLSRFIATAAVWPLQLLQGLLIVVLLKLLLFDLPSWDLTLAYTGYGDSIRTLRYGGIYSLEMALMRLLDFAALIGFLLLALRRLAATDSETGNIRAWLGATALLLLFVFLSLEINSLLYQFVPGLRSGGVSILWSIFALTLVFNGIKHQHKSLRFCGLALFALVAWKVFFIDLARLEQLYRIVAFIALGLLALGGAFIYMLYRQSFIGKTDTGKST